MTHDQQHARSKTMMDAISEYSALRDELQLRRARLTNELRDISRQIRMSINRSRSSTEFYTYNTLRSRATVVGRESERISDSIAAIENRLLLLELTVANELAEGRPKTDE